VVNLKGKRPLGRPRHRLEDTMDLREIRWVWTELICLRIGTSRALVNTIIILSLPNNFGKILSS
jgi:hypothetical protein